VTKNMENQRQDSFRGGGVAHDADQLREFAERCTEAWCSQDPEQVAANFASGSLTINESDPSVGRAAITEAARSLMVAFPDMKVLMDDLRIHGEGAEYHWTLVGTNTGPGGSGKTVRISGFEEWIVGEDGLNRFVARPFRRSRVRATARARRRLVAARRR
jgi:nuclear transport factor 2 (NTF2) superfamily protein